MNEINYFFNENFLDHYNNHNIVIFYNNGDDIDWIKKKWPKKIDLDFVKNINNYNDNNNNNKFLLLTINDFIIIHDDDYLIMNINERLQYYLNKFPASLL
jgi:hypothetical protein